LLGRHPARRRSSPPPSPSRLPRRRLQACLRWPSGTRLRRPVTSQTPMALLRHLVPGPGYRPSAGLEAPQYSRSHASPEAASRGTDVPTTQRGVRQTRSAAARLS
jgi:hypothetical protein